MPDQQPGDGRGIRFSVQSYRSLPTLGIFALLGVLITAAARIHAAFTGFEGKQPWALVFLLLVLPGIWVVASKPVIDLRSASIAQNTLQLTFRDGIRMRIAAMPLRDSALLAEVLVARCPQAELPRHG